MQNKINGFFFETNSFIYLALKMMHRNAFFLQLVRSILWFYVSIMILIVIVLPDVTKSKKTAQGSSFTMLTKKQESRNSPKYIILYRALYSGLYGVRFYHC